MTEWFEEWFGEEYLQLYPHRNDADAEQLVALIAAALPLPRAARVLDIACGAGRHARAFGARGLLPVGLDLSWALLLRARATAAIPVVRCDMRTLPIRPGTFDLAVNLFTSFGYFDDDADHQRALNEMVATVRRGGWFVLDFLNADRVRGALVPHECATLGGVEVRIERRLVQDDRYVLKTITTPDRRQFRERVRLFPAADLERMLERAGCRVAWRFGGYAGQPPSTDAPRVILIGAAG